MDSSSQPLKPDEDILFTNIESNKAQEITGEYQQIQVEKDEVEIDNGLGIFIKRKVLYHGSRTSGMTKLNLAEDTTVGNGVYLTSVLENAIGYARCRSDDVKDASPIVYETSVENMNLLDLRNDENTVRILKEFVKVLQKESEREDVDKIRKQILAHIAKKIMEFRITHLKDVTQYPSALFSEYVKSLGYEGLICFEGGEGEYVKDHDTYLIFDPAKVKINTEHKIL